MPSYGVTATGFLAKTMDVLVEEVEAAVKTEFGFVPRGFLKKFIAIICERFTELWEIAELSFTAMDPDKVTDAIQDALNSLTGTIRNEAVATTVTLTCTGTPATLIASASQAQNPVTSDKFETLAAGTIVALTAWAPSTAYVVGDRRTNSSRAYVCTVAGTSAASGGPTTTDESIVDGAGSLRWRYIGEGTGAVDIAAKGTVTGPILATSGSITAIVTLVTGWSSVKNLTDGIVGRNKETNEAYRIRREEELSQAGATTPDAIRAELLKVASVTSATVFYNPTDVTDVDGVPPHAVECLIRGGTDQAIRDSLGKLCIAAGIGTHGTVTGTWTDSEGTAHTIKFSRPTEINIYVDLTVEKEAATFPADGATQIKTKIVSYGQAQKSGKNAVPSSIGSQAFGVTGTLAVPADTLYVYTDVIGTPVAWAPSTAYVATAGARSVVTNGGRAYICITAGTSASSGGPTGTGTDITDGTAHWYYLGNVIQISTRQLAVFDSSRIDVVTTDGTP